VTGFVNIAKEHKDAIATAQDVADVGKNTWDIVKEIEKRSGVEKL